MIIYFFTGVFLVTILNTVSSNKNATKQLQNSNLTANENRTSLGRIKLGEKYNAYIDAELQKVWEKFLAEARITEFTPKSIGTERTTAMSKDNAVTEVIKAFRERGKQQEKKFAEREAKTIMNFTPNPGAGTYGIRNDETVHNSRRQKKQYERKNPFAAAINIQGAGDDDELIFESYRQPYWAEGDYVFLRTGSPTPSHYPGDTSKPMDVFRGCDRSCNHYFKTYGKVCGHRYDQQNTKNHYRNFNNICDIDHENCIHKRMRQIWHPMYRGNCTELDKFTNMVFWSVEEIRDRKKKWDPYVYVPPTPTQSTRDPDGRRQITLRP